MRPFVLRFLGILAVVIFINSAAFAAETTASIIGFVRDDKGGPLPGATVSGVNNATNFTRSTVSEESGSYRLALPPPGTYNITVEVAGFAKEVQKGIILNVGKEIVLDFALKLATTGEALEIIGETPLIDATKSAIGQTVTDNTIKSLPLNGR
ncbi:MAG TPA: carboxypeptidase-like regulatory domain-containing protein, partial [Acidobacteriota bacterium]